jgi:anti-sigma factor RsiW
LPEVGPEFEQLSAYLDGELSAADSQAVETWLQQDPQAQRLYQQLQMLQSKLDHLPVPYTSPPDLEQLTERVFAVVADSWWRDLRHRAQRVIPQVAAAMAVLVGSGYLGWRWVHPQPVVSLDTPPVQVSRLPASSRTAGRYLLEAADTQDAYTILFVSDATN